MAVDDEARRAERQRAIIEGRTKRASGGAGPRLEPPYHLYGLDMLYFLCRFEPEDVRRLVPEPLAPSGSNWGLVAGYLAPHGWEIAPFSAFYMCIEIAGFDGPDGFPCMYQFAGHYGPRAYDVFASTYNRDVQPGEVSFELGESRIALEGRQGSDVLLRMSGTRRLPSWEPKNGVNRYATPMPGGGYGLFSVPFTCPFVELDAPSVEITVAGRAAGLPVPVEVTWAIACHGSSVTLGVPRRITATSEELAEDGRAAEIVELFGRVGRSALVVGDGGAVARMNAGAFDFYREGRLPIAGDRLRLAGQALAALEAARMAGRGSGDAVSDRFTIGVAGEAPLIGQCLALRSGEAILFLDDPARAPAPGAEQSLQLLGLTPAEARIAASIGGGRSPRQAAVDLGLSHNTVRSALKTVFDKLSISRQAELARVVTRLDATGAAPGQAGA